MEWKEIPLKFDGKCKDCKQVIKEGKTAMWKKGNGVKHVSCYKRSLSPKSDIHSNTDFGPSKSSLTSNVIKECFHCKKREGGGRIIFNMQSENFGGIIHVCDVCYQEPKKVYLKEESKITKSLISETKPKKPRKFTTSTKIDVDQKDAVQYPYDKPLTVRAGPGAGKTLVVSERIKDIILEQGIKEDRILCLSFSRTAAKTMQDRFAKDKDLQDKKIKIPKDNVNTIHALARMISPKKMDVLPDKKNPTWREFQKKLAPKDYPILNAEYPINFNGDDDFRKKLQDGVKTWKSELLSSVDLKDYIITLEKKRESLIHDADKTVFLNMIESYNELYKYFKSYEQLLARTKTIDYEDMLKFGLEYLEKSPDIRKKWQKKYDHIIVDEFQDNNYLQTRIVELLLPDNKNVNAGSRKVGITVIGDEDQCIYSFQGAMVDNFDRFKGKHDETIDIILRTNYRSTPEIVGASQALIDAEPKRVPKGLVADKKRGEPVYLDGYDWQTEAREKEFIKKKISELNDRDVAILLRTNKKADEYREYLRNQVDSPKKRITTFHKAKGKEYSVVFIPNIVDEYIPIRFRVGDFNVPSSMKKIPGPKEDSDIHEQEERRILYVGMTRAKEKLFLTFHESKEDDDSKTRKTQHSKFLDDFKEITSVAEE